MVTQALRKKRRKETKMKQMRKGIGDIRSRTQGRGHIEGFFFLENKWEHSMLNLKLISL